MAKGQTEIMGLIVIVVLVTLGLFFMVSFQVQKQPPQVKKTFDIDQLGSNFLLSFLQINIGCGNYNMEDMIQDCALDQQITCRGMDSCDYVNRTAGIMINHTFENWSRDYKFSIEYNGLSDDIIWENHCNESMERKSAFQPLSLYPNPNNVILSIDICS